MNSYFSYFRLPFDVTSRMEQIRFILLNLFVLFLPFDRFYSTLILYLLIITTLIDLNKEKIKLIPRQFWVFQMVFWISLSGYFYSHNKSDAGFLIERQLAILILPIIIPLAVKLTKERVNIILTTFTASCIITIMFLFGYAFYTLNSIGMSFSYLFSPAFFNHKFSSPIDIHAGYLSMYVSLCLIYLLTRLAATTLAQKIIITMALFVLTFGLLFLAARNILIYTVIILLFIYPFYYIKKKIKYFLTCIMVLSISTFFITSNQFLKNRFSINLMEDINFNKTKLNIEEIEPRSERWLLGIDLFKKSPVIGYGTGDEIQMLKTEYKKKGHVISYLDNYNVHNQYLSILIKHGIVGLIFFLGIFYYFFKVSIQSKYFMYFIFLFGICFFFLTENVLDANKGIFFFAVFNTLFGYTALFPDEPPVLKNGGIISGGVQKNR